MTQQTFTVGRKPRVVMNRIYGDLSVRPWGEQRISVNILGDEGNEGRAARVYQEGETVFIEDCRSNIELLVPYEKKLLGFASLTTDISVTDLEGSVVMENVGNVELTNVRGGVELTQVNGNLRATNVPMIREHRGIGGDAILTSVSHAELGAVGGSLMAVSSVTVTTGAVGGSLKADQIGALLKCGAVGGSCDVRNSPNAEVAVSNVGGSLQLDGVARMPSCNVGGSLNMLVDVPAGSSMHLLVGGSATIALPRNANLRVHAMAGGSISGDAVSQKKFNIANFTYGSGAATLNVTAGGSIRLIWADAMSVAPTNTRRDTPEENQSPAQNRQSILQMVAQGRITPEEGNVLLDALGE